MSLSSKSVVLTGGAGGIGQLVSAKLVEYGAHVTIIDPLPPKRPLADYIEGDLGTVAGIGTVRDALAQRPCDILINLAGIQHFGLFESQPPAQIEATYIVNLLAPVLLTHAVLPAMKRRASGQIVNIGSIFGSIAFAHFVTYSSTKAGLRGFSEALRRELKGSGIDVTYIAPRAVKTALNSGPVMQFAKATKMNMDAPETVAGKIVAAIVGRRKDVYIGFPESLFVRVNSLVPRVVDAALSGGDKCARKILASMPA
ncbi:MAG: SDR family oxidoreductase [Rhodobacteraceae bacterium]|nr:SDR family oxidoreductase [Paracoccaceae bacterium]